MHDYCYYYTFYSTLSRYLVANERFAMLGNVSKNVKNCFVLPLGKGEKLHECLMPLNGPGLPGEVSDDGKKRVMLLALIIRWRRVKEDEVRSRNLGNTHPVKLIRALGILRDALFCL